MATHLRQGFHLRQGYGGQDGGHGNRHKKHIKDQSILQEATEGTETRSDLCFLRYLL